MDWTYIGKQFSRLASACYNKYFLVNEPPFTEIQHAKLAKWWKTHCSDAALDFVEIVQELQPHSKRGILLELQSITKGTKIEFRMSREEWVNYEL